jgi:4-hydroxythreonine-4-phosphate dehydrogenase
MTKPRVALLLGDHSGIGPEIVVKLLSCTEEVAAAKILVIGEHWAFEKAQRMIGVNIKVAPVTDPDQFKVVFSPAFLETNFLQQNELTQGHSTARSGAAVIRSLKLAMDWAKHGCIDAVCYAPLNKQSMHMAGLQFPDELRFFAHELGYTGDAGEINVLGNAWTSRVTSHVPISEVSRLITAASIQKAIRLIHQTIKKSGIDSPRIAVAALNPHAGEGGNFGREEIDVIRPAILKAAAKGINVDGPFPADSIFLKLRDWVFDAVVTMYHDQGQIAMKLMGFQRGVTVSGGLPIPITTPAHGTAFDIVGQGLADAGAMVEAFRLAVRLAGCSHGVTS